jgi:hypothetical protein
VSPPLAGIGEVICGRVSDVMIMVEGENKRNLGVLKGSELAQFFTSLAFNLFSFL